MGPQGVNRRGSGVCRGWLAGAGSQGNRGRPARCHTCSEPSHGRGMPAAAASAAAGTPALTSRISSAAMAGTVPPRTRSRC